jgi:hypothetical protein
MNLLEGLTDLQGNALNKVLRRTILSALIVGAVAVIITAFLGSLWGALGLIIGLALAIVNLRLQVLADLRDDAHRGCHQPKQEADEQESRRRVEDTVQPNAEDHAQAHTDRGREPHAEEGNGAG